MLTTWFNAYKKIVYKLDIHNENIYNIDEIGFLIKTMESTRIIINLTYYIKH